MTQLDQLASLTTIVADTGDIASIAKIQPQDATTNPSLILKASKDPAYRAFLTEAVENSVSLEDAAARVLVNFGAEILKYVKGRVSTEVDARCENMSMWGMKLSRFARMLFLSGRMEKGFAAVS